MALSVYLSNNPITQKIRDCLLSSPTPQGSGKDFDLKISTSNHSSSLFINILIDTSIYLSSQSLNVGVHKVDIKEKLQLP